MIQYIVDADVSDFVMQTIGGYIEKIIKRIDDLYSHIRYRFSHRLVVLRWKLTGKTRRDPLFQVYQGSHGRQHIRDYEHTYHSYGKIP
jgi:hypothetical protein